MSEVKQAVLSNAERMLNVGVEIELKKLGKVTVKELSLEQVIKLASSVKLLMDELSKIENKDTAIFSLLESPSVFAAIQDIASATTGKDRDLFKDMGMSDWLKLIKAFKDVMDWEELQELFFQIVPMAMIRELSKKG